MSGVVGNSYQIGKSSTPAADRRIQQRFIVHDHHAGGDLRLAHADRGVARQKAIPRSKKRPTSTHGNRRPAR